MDTCSRFCSEFYFPCGGTSLVRGLCCLSASTGLLVNWLLCIRVDKNRDFLNKNQKKSIFFI